MKSLFVLLALTLSTFAQAETFTPNNCGGGGVYRALNGPAVVTDAAGNKSLSLAGKTLVSCSVGNSECNAPYNNYACKFDSKVFTGAEAALIQSNLAANVNVAGMTGLPMSYDLQADFSCGYMHCVSHQTLKCDSSSSCEITPVVEGWDE